VKTAYMEGLYLAGSANADKSTKSCENGKLGVQEFCGGPLGLLHYTTMPVHLSRFTCVQQCR